MKPYWRSHAIVMVSWNFTFFLVLSARTAKYATDVPDVCIRRTYCRYPIWALTCKGSGQIQTDFYDILAHLLNYSHHCLIFCSTICIIVSYSAQPLTSFYNILLNYSHHCLPFCSTIRIIIWYSAQLFASLSDILLNYSHHCLIFC